MFLNFILDTKNKIQANKLELKCEIFTYMDEKHILYYIWQWPLQILEQLEIKI